ncbi:hypothetical protein ACFO4E_04305 [Nocardiopsis mangrovi]|uniref:ABC transporter permease n=1 Tax=Nocardiopsis mangrovi TaxID=1179818 RepID=A0ABV9DQ68_9ACTN
MRPASILSEALRNLVTGTTRAAVLGLALFAVTAGLAIVDTRYIVGLERQAAEFVASGASVRTLVAEGMTDGESCELLTESPAIRSSGALREADALELSAMPADPLPVYEVTPGLAALLGVAGTAAEGVWLPAPLAETLGVRPGERLDTGSGPMTVAGTYDHPDDGRDRRLGHAVLVPRIPTATFDECWAEVWPVSEAADALVYAAADVVPDATTTITIGQLNTAQGTDFDATAQFAARPTRHAAAGCAAAGFALGFAAVRLRRLEIAGALHVGVGRGALLAQTAIETGAWALGALAMAVGALACAAGIGNPADTAEVFAIGLRGPGAAALTAVLGAACALLLIREKHLFRYFKGR